MGIKEKAVEVLKEEFICNRCLGRNVAGQLLSGLTNEERGKIIRQFIAFLIDSGEKIEVELSNFYGMKFRNVKIKPKEPGKCKICKNFFLKKIDQIAKAIKKESKGIEFDNFLIGSIIPDDILRAEESLWGRIGIEWVESIKSEINRELGKKVEKLIKKKYRERNPDITFIVNLNTGKIKTGIRSLYIFGKYKKLKKGFPQTKWVCRYCRGKGCKYCKGKGKLYPTSIQEIIEKPFLKETQSKESKLSAAGREDIDARCLDYRPFIIELVKPTKRRIDLKKIQRGINRSKKIKVSKLKFTEKSVIRRIKSTRVDKTYLVTVNFKKNIEKEKLKELKKLTEEPILQKTPLRVLQRRTDKFRKRLVKKISWKILKKKKLQLKIRAESGLYIKELITGDEGRTKPNISELLNNKAKKIGLDVIKIHSKNLKI